jgi:hypothetical protein
MKPPPIARTALPTAEQVRNRFAREFVPLIAILAVGAIAQRITHHIVTRGKP